MLNISTLTQKVLKSDLCTTKKEKLLAVIDTIDIKDIREQALQHLFDRENVVAGIDPWNCKVMMIELMRALAANDLSFLVERNAVSEHLKKLEALFHFFDVLDDPDYRKIQDIEYILENGEDEFNPARQARNLITVDSIFQSWCSAHRKTRITEDTKEVFEEPV